MKIIGQKIKGIDTYFGGKGANGTYQQIINCIRPHERLVIPFLGNGSIARNIKSAHSTIGNDVSSCIVKFWKNMNFDWIDIKNQDAIMLLKNLIGVQHHLKTVVYMG